VQTRTHLLRCGMQPDVQTHRDMHVQRLRTKLGKAGDWIETVRGVGYRLRQPPGRGRQRS
jgi:two-component system phosphate regulon response regulator PhoB